MTWKKRIITIALSSALLALVLVGCRQETSSDDSEEPASDPDDGMTAAAELIADIPTTQAFTDDEVPDEDIDKILSAGINAPSAINGQNWHFTAVTDDDVLQQIADSMGGGKPADPTSGSESGEQPDNTASAEDTAGEETDSGDAAPAESSTGTAKAGITDAPLAIEISCKEGSEFDAGLACQNMSAEAQLLGYGTKIISSPTYGKILQEAFRELLGIPDDQSAVAVLLIGKADTSSDADAVSAATTRKDTDEVVTKVSA